MKELISKLENKLRELDSTTSSDSILIDYFTEALSRSDKKGMKVYEIFLLCYFAKNDDDFLTVKMEVESQKELLYKYFEDTHNINPDISEDITNIFNLSYFDSSPLGKEKYRDTLFRTLSIILYTQNIKEIYDKLNLPKIARNLTTKVLKEKLKIDDTWQSIREKYKILVKKVNREYAKMDKEADVIIDIIEELVKQYSKNSVITMQNSLIDKIGDDSLRYDVYKTILEYNNEKYISASKENKILKLKNIKYLKYIFSKYGFNINNLPDNIIKIITDYGNLDNITCILNILKLQQFNVIDFSSESGIKALVNTNIDILNKIIELIKLGVITSDFVMANQNILYDVDITKDNEFNGLYSTLYSNYSHLKSNNFNVEESKLNESLLVNREIIESSTSLFKKYGLNIKNALTKSMFTNKKFFSYIDSFIELGFSSFISDNYSIISDNCDMVIKRIYIAKMMRVSIFDHNGRLLPEITTGNGFYVENKDLDNYISLNTSDMIPHDFLSILDSDNSYECNCSCEPNEFDKAFSLNSTTYSFDNILISRNKVLRNYNILKNKYPNYDISCLLESSIIHNSILDIDSVFSIRRSLDEYFKGKQKRI